MSSDLFDFVKWYLAISLLGALALPLVFKLFRRLPDRGYTLARTVGLLAACYIFWLSGSLGLLHNDAAGAKARLLNQGEVPAVQGAHRGDQSDARAGPAERRDGAAERGNRFCDSRTARHEIVADRDMVEFAAGGSKPLLLRPFRLVVKQWQI